MNIAIQGQSGSFHHAAATSFFGDTTELVYCKDFESVIKAVDVGDADRGVLAIENSIYGSINQTYDLLLTYRPWIIGEIYQHITMHLLAKKGCDIQNITDIYSQIPALEQCREYLKKHLPNARLHEWHDTAAAAEHVHSLIEKNAAAIASKAAATTYGLVSLAGSIEDNQHSYTRFIVIQKNKNQVQHANKTSAILKTNHTPGALHRALAVFADQNINLDCLVSRPIPGPHRTYMFYLDFLADSAAQSTQVAIQQLEAQGAAITLLGSYVADSP